MKEYTEPRMHTAEHLLNQAMVRLFGSMIVASSNSKFEKYMPYNYTGNSFGIAYSLSY